MKKLFVFALLLSVAGMAWAQNPVTLAAQPNTPTRLSNGVDYSSMVTLTPGQRDTSRGMWIYNTGGYFTAEVCCSLSAGGKLSIGYLKSQDGTNYVYGDSLVILSAITSSGFQHLSYNFPIMANTRLTFSNSGSGNAKFKLVGTPPVMWMW